MTDLNIIVGVQSGDAIRQLSNVQKGVDNVGAATKRTTQQLQKHSSQYNRTAVAANKFGKGLAQQAGYQIADFAVQIQNGTNAMQAFGQQGSQLLAVFGPVGSVLGAVVAVGSAVATIFMSAKKSTNQFKDAISALKEETEQANQELQVFLSGAKSFAQYQVMQKIADLQSQIAQEQTELTENEAASGKSAIQRARANRAIIKGLQDQLQINQNLFDENERVLSAKQNALNIAEQMSAIELGHLRALGKQNDSYKMMDDVVRQFYVNQITLEHKLGLAREANFDASKLNLQQQIQIVQTEIALRKELGKKIKDEAELQILLEQQKLSIMNSGKLLTTSQIIQLQDMTREFLEQKGALKEILDLEARRAKALSGVAEISKYIETYGDGLDGASAAFADWGEMADTSTKKTKELAKTVTNELSPAAQRLVDISNSIGSSFENAMMSAVRGTMSVKDAFRTMAADIIAELYRVFVVKQITGFISNAIMGGMGYNPVEGGGYTMRPRARPRAAGGPVSAGSPYLVGERGPELIVPNRSGTVIPNNQLGGGGVVVNQVINISTGVQQTVRAEIRQLMPQIADSAKAAVSDAKRRGGSYGRAFA